MNNRIKSPDWDDRDGNFDKIPNKPEGEVRRKARQKTRREGRNNRCVRRGR